MSRTVIAFARRGFSATGGAEAYLRRLARKLFAAGHSVRLYADKWPDSQWRYGEIVRVRSSSPSGFARAVQRRRRDEEILFSFERIPGCDIFRAGDGVHASWLAGRARFEPAWKRWLVAMNPKHRQILTLERGVFAGDSNTLVIANSNLVRDEILAFHPAFPAGNIRVIPNGFDPPKTRADAPDKAALRRAMHLPSDCFVALFAGTGWERKGLQHAIRTTERIPGCRLLVAGKGPAKRNSAPHVFHLGPRDDLTPIFHAADVLLHPTWYDPFSNACLEALAAGLPVITTRDNGFSEILEEGVTGSVVPRADSHAEIKAALRFWRSADRLCAAAACRARASDFPLKTNCEKTLDVIREAEELAET